MPRLLIFLSVFALSACAQTEGQRHIREYLTYQATQNHICRVHHVQMDRQMVPISFGYPMASDEYRSASKRFPNAVADFNAGCVVDPKLLKTKVPVYVCPDCKREERRWALKHRRVPEAQNILANRNPVEPMAWTY